MNLTYFHTSILAFYCNCHLTSWLYELRSDLILASSHPSASSSLSHDSYRACSVKTNTCFLLTTHCLPHTIWLLSVIMIDADCHPSLFSWEHRQLCSFGLSASDVCGIFMIQTRALETTTRTLFRCVTHITTFEEHSELWTRRLLCPIIFKHSDQRG